MSVAASQIICHLGLFFLQSVNNKANDEKIPKFNWTLVRGITD